ncbi:MAG TPA: 16S rRNA (guanine(527)-N(7))-methyltransferase RsmG [Bryobacteraceae bacterium]
MPVPAWFTEVLDREVGRWATLSPSQISALYAHYELLDRWNQKLSLTSLTPGPELVVRHYCESLFLAAQLSAQVQAHIADIGSGAGFPGVPIAILRPDWNVSLVESNQRKAVFLREATRGLSNVSVVAQRAEELNQGFDWLVARAVDPMEVVKNVPRLASRVGLLIGESALDGLKSASSIAWAKPIRLPWGDRRICVLGEFHVEQGST